MSKKKQESECLGRSCGGFSTKIHAVCDALGNPIRFILTAGQEPNFNQAIPLLTGISGDYLLADRGYDSDKIVEFAEENGIKPVFPPKKNRIIQIIYDKENYKERNLVEHLFLKLKHFRRIATRYNKTATTSLAFIHLIPTILLIK